MSLRMCAWMSYVAFATGCLAQPTAAPTTDEPTAASTTSEALEAPTTSEASEEPDASRFCSIDGCDPEEDCCFPVWHGTTVCFRYARPGENCA